MVLRKNAESYRLGAMNFYDNASEDYAYDVSMGIVNLGVAHDCSDEIAKVQINLGDDIRSFQLYINPDKFKNFDEEERAGVVWHELNHIIHKHLGMSVNDKSLKMDNQKLLTMAQEIVCNDTVLYHGVKLPCMDGIIYGDKYLNQNTYPHTTKEVYDMLVDESENNPDSPINDYLNSEENNTPCSAHGNIMDADGNPVDLDEIFENMTAQSDDSDDNDEEAQGTAPGENLEDTLDEIANIVNNSANDVNDGMNNATSVDDKGNRAQQSSPGSGSGDASMNSLDTQNMNATPDDWTQFLRDIDPRIDISNPGDDGMFDYLSQESDWANQPIYMHSMHAHGVSGRLPSMKPMSDVNDTDGNVKPSIIFAIDQSGSIGIEEAKGILGLVKFIPEDKVDVKMCVYGDYSEEVTLDELHDDHSISSKNIGYGTNFSAIDYFVKSTDMDYHNTTIVNFTDGEAAFISGIPDNIDNYVFVDIVNKDKNKIFECTWFSDEWKNYVDSSRRYSILDVYAPFFDEIY